MDTWDVVGIDPSQSMCRGFFVSFTSKGLTHSVKNTVFPSCLVGDVESMYSAQFAIYVYKKQGLINS